MKERERKRKKKNKQEKKRNETKRKTNQAQGLEVANQDCNHIVSGWFLFDELVQARAKYKSL